MKTGHLRLAAFALGTLASFLLGLYFFPSSIRGYVARATLGLSKSTDQMKPVMPLTKGEFADTKELIVSDEVLRAALEKAGPPPKIKRPGFGDFPTTSEISFVRSHLTIEPLDSSDPAASLVSLSFSGHEAVWSVSFLDRLAQQAISELNAHADQTAAEASNDGTLKLALAERREQAARRALDDFLGEHFDALSRAVTNRHADPSTIAGNSTDPVMPVPKLNPKWQGLQEQLAAEISKREQLLLGRTPEHPEVQEAAVRIEAIKEQLDKTPKFLVDEHDPLAGRAPRRKWTGVVRPAQFTQGEATPADRSKLATDSNVPDEYEGLLAALHEARDARLAAERIVESSQPSIPVVRGKIVATARLAQTLREPPSTGRLTVLALAAIFAGACLAAMIRTPRNSPLLTTIYQVETDLSLPVVGVVPSPTTSAVALSR